MERLKERPGGGEVVRPPAFIGMKKCLSTFHSLVWSVGYKTDRYLKFIIAINLPNRLSIIPQVTFFIFINELKRVAYNLGLSLCFL